MSTIDNRVVEMNFDGSKFSGGVTHTLSMLDKLKAALHLGGASKGLQDVNAAAHGFDSSAMEQGASRIAGSFTAMQAVAFGALANIGAKVASTAIDMAKSFTLAPLTAGFQEYELKMGSIQTILANTSRYGTSLETVNASLEQLNKYADQTIYNFGDMTKNIGLFTNAGIRVEDATTMIKGFSNAAAASGTNAEGAASAAYQLSQALSAGKVTLMDWRSLQNVGMGNKNMQQGIIDIAEAMGTMQKAGLSSKDVQENFNGSLEKGWLSADVMSTYLKIMSGDMDEASIAALGMSKAQVELLRQQAKTGLEAATKVRTFTQLMSTLRESVGSGWSESFGILFGDFNEATDLFSGLSQSVGGFLGRMASSRNELLQGWKDLGGRDTLLVTLEEAFWALAAPISQVGQAFRDVFPKTTVNQLVALTNSIYEFFVELRPAPETLDRLQRTFAGLFAILGIGWEVIKAVAKFLGDLLLGVTEGDQGILRFTATIGDFLVGLHAAIRDGEGLTSFFNKIRDIIFKLLNPIRDFGQMLGKMFEGLDTGALGGAIGRILDGLLSFNAAGEKTVGVWDKIKAGLSGFGKFFLNLARNVANFVKPVTDAIANALKNINFQDVNDALQTLALGGIALFIKQLGGMFKGLEIFKGAGGGIVSKIKDGIGGLTKTLSAMQANIKASMVLKIAAAIALLAVSVVLLASVDAAGLARATGALTVMFVQLGAAMQVFQKIGTVASILKLNLLGSALILMGVAILLLAGAVKVLSSMSWEELAKGLIGLTVLIGGLIAMSKGLDKSRGAIIRSALSLVIMAFALKQLVDVVKELGALDLETLAKGIGGVALLLVAIALFTKIQSASGDAVAQSVSLLLLAIAIKTLADAVKTFAEMSWEELARGFAGMAAGLIAMGIALNFMPKGPQMILTALAIGKVAGAVSLIALAFKMFNDISWEVIARGLLGIGGAMTILTVAMNKMPKIGAAQSLGILIVAAAIRILVESLVTMGNLDLESLAQGLTGLAFILGIVTIAMKSMEGSERGAVSLLIMAAALRILLPVITTLGAMPIGSIVAALLALTAVFVILGLAGLVLAPVVPTILGLGIAIGLLGLGLALAGAGVFLFATGLTLLAAAGAAATVTIVAMVSGLIGLIPMVLEQIGLGLVAFAGVIASAQPAMVGAMVAVLNAILSSIIEVIPNLLTTLGILLDAFLKFVLKYVPKLVETGIKLIIALLDGIGRNIGKVIDKATDIIVNFINAIGRNLPRIIQAGVDLVISFMNGVGDGVRNNGPKIADAAWNMVTGIIDGVVSGLKTLGGKVLTAMLGMIKRAWNGVLSFFGINSPSTEGMWVGRMIDEGIANGLTHYSTVAETAAVNMGENVLDSMTKTISGLGDLISGDVDMNPVIAPVLDLTDVRKDAAGIGAILAAQPLDVGTAYSGAANASAGYRSNQAALEEANAPAAEEHVMFVQNNYSPKAITPAEVYRNTKSQLSVAKEALKTNAN